ncbi:MAG: O-antigen ligase family protein [bacterium]
MNHNRIIRSIIDGGLIFIVVFAPLAFGAVHIWAYTMVVLLVFFILILCIVTNYLFAQEREAVVEKELLPVYSAFALFLVTVCFQIVPLPPNIIRLLSPQAHKIYSMAIPGYDKSIILRSLSIYPYATKIYLVKFISYMGIFFLITIEIREIARIKRILIALILVGFFEALYGLYGYFSKNYSIFGFAKLFCSGPATGTFVNRNHFAGFLGMTVFVCIGYLLSKTSMRSRASYGFMQFQQRIIDFLNTARASESGLLLIIIITMIIGIVFSLSRMGVFSFVVALLIISFLTILDRQKKLIAIIFLVFSLALATSLWYGIDPLVDRYYTAGTFFSGRAVVWEATCELIKDFPLIGTGLGTYKTVFQRYKPEDFDYRLLLYDHAHNDYLEMISEVGIIGIIPLFWGNLSFLLLILKKWAKTKNAFSKGISLGGVGALSYISLHSLMDFNLHIPANAMIFFIIMALTYCGATAG